LPLISKVWLGKYEETFVTIGMLLIIGRFINILNAPSYIAYLGIGELRWNVISHITIGVLNLCLGFILGLHLGGIGVVIASIISLAFGSSIINLSYYIKYKINIIKLIPRKSRQISLLCLMGLLIYFLIIYNFDKSYEFVTINILFFFLFLTFILISVWIHPMRKRLTEWIMNALLLNKL